ncbi:MAG: T9SS type A sorting domain-containing protein [Bacteroidales bacterium]|nr:T9SS type A sorting domain-containing protein [Bacteroidales bacterium]
MKNLFYNLRLKSTLLFLSIIMLNVNVNAQNYWTGGSNTDWNNTANWSNSTVPDINTDVIIEGTATYFPVINTLGDSCNSLLIRDGASLDIQLGGYLYIGTDLTVGEGISGILNCSDETIDVSGNLILNNSAGIYMTNCNINAQSTSLNDTSSVTYSGTDMLICNWNYGNLVLNGSGIMQITGDNVTPTICRNLTINNTGNSLVIPVNKAITVTDTIINNVGYSGIIIESDTSGDGSLISNSPNINATVKRYIAGNRWYYLSSPIDAAPVSLFNTNNLLWWDASIEWTGVGDYTPWKGVSDTSLQNATGYAYYFYEDTIEYKGNINVGNYTITLRTSATGLSDYQGWNLIGNPYTSILDWDVLVADGAVPADAEDAIYFFDDDAGDGSQNNYRYYVPSTGGTYGVGTADATGKIPLGQAFFIKTNTDNVNLTINNTYRNHNTQAFYKNKTLEIIKLQITGNNKSDELIYRIVKDASPYFDGKYDAIKLFSGNEDIPQIYSYNKENDEKIAINSIPAINKDTKLFIGFKAPAGQYSINIQDFTLPDTDGKLYLFDSYLKNYIDIIQNKEYTFEHQGGENNDRFVLTYKNTYSDISDYDLNEIKIYPNPAKDFLNVKYINNYLSEETKTIEILSVTGKTVYSSELNNKTTTINLRNFSDGIWFLKLTDSNNKTYTEKFIIRK